MRASHELSRVEVSFDDPNLVSHAGLLQAASLWQRLGMPGVVRRGLRLPGSVGANSDAKVATVVLGMLAGADSIDDLDVLRAGATGRLLGAAKAPSTIGTWLRSFTYGHLRQLDAIARQLLMVCWAAGAGPHRLDELLYLDLDSTIVESHGLAKRGAFFGYTKVRGHHPLIARVSEPTQPGWIAHTRFRRGNAGAGRGGAHFLAETISRVRAAGSTGALLVRADSGFYDSRFIAACRRAKVRFSVTARIDAAVARAIASIPDDAWVPIPYWDAVEDDDGIIVASSAEVAETTFTAFTSTRAPVTARLVVRRVRRLREAATGQPLDQQALPVPVWRHHAVLTDRLEPLLDVEREHRAHAVVEQSIAELKGGPLAHLPSGDFWANAAWVTLAAMTVNMGRALATLAGHGLGEATLGTLQRTLLAVPARLARSARRYHLHLPTGWPWQTALTWLKRRIDALPLII